MFKTFGESISDQFYSEDVLDEVFSTKPEEEDFGDSFEKPQKRIIEVLFKTQKVYIYYL